MRAILSTKYGPPEVLRLGEVEAPSPGAGEVLIKVAATTVTRYDCWARSCRAHTGLDPLMRMWFGVRRPRRPILGTELSGEIAAVGEGTEQFEVGDRVIAYPGMNMGAYAEYACVPETSVTRMPRNLTFKEAASIMQGALTAMEFLRLASVKSGHQILIIGASGGVGIPSVQLAKHHFGATVTGVCSSAKLEFVKSLGADEVVDYTHESMTGRSKKYDVVFDTYGKSTLADCRLLQKKGAFLFATYGIRQLAHMLWLRLTGRKVISPLLHETPEDLAHVVELVEAGTLRPVVDRCFPMEEAVEAHRYFEAGGKKGSVVILFERPE